jgi:hypothetical protein
MPAGLNVALEVLEHGAEILGADADIVQDRQDERSRQVAAGVMGNRRRPAIGVPVEYVAATSAFHHETQASQCALHGARIDSW